MCFKGKFLNISVKTTCFVLAIINAIANALSLICFSFMGIGVLLAALINGGGGISMKIGGVRFKRNIEEDDNLKQTLLGLVDDVILDYWIPYPYLLIICGLFSLITFIFSVMLCYGINNRRWRLVKAYFIYGCVITALALVFTIVQASVGPMSRLVVMGLVGFVVHSLFLQLVHETYNQFLQDAMISVHSHLIDNEDIRELM